jgi:hypothetical protein
MNMSTNFENEVLHKLSSIEDRLSNIEERFDEATNFAEGILSDEEGMLGREGLNSIKETLSAFLPLQVDDSAGDSGESDPNSIQDLVGSLKDFRNRLSGLKTAIANMPDEPSNTLDKEEG